LLSPEDAALAREFVQGRPVELQKAIRRSIERSALPSGAGLQTDPALVGASFVN
jgi:hypothetical protein